LCRSDISYENNKDIDEKVAKCRHICGSIHRNLKNKTTKFYKTVAVPSETRAIRKKDKDKIQSAEMKFLRSPIGCKLLDRRKNEEIRKEVTALNDKITENRRKRNEERLPIKAWKYKPKGRRDVGRPRKRWKPEQVD
jgi:hypothetical protein